jgi:hypothetical protein
MSTQKDIIGAMKQQTPGPSRRALIASGVATSTAAIRYDRSTSTPAVCCAQRADNPRRRGNRSNRPVTALRAKASGSETRKLAAILARTSFAFSPSNRRLHRAAPDRHLPACLPRRGRAVRGGLTFLCESWWHRATGKLELKIHAKKHRPGGRDSGYSPDSITRSSRKRISPSLLASEITKRT